MKSQQDKFDYNYINAAVSGRNSSLSEESITEQGILILNFEKLKR